MLEQDRYTMHTTEHIWFQQLLLQSCTADSMPKLLFASKIWITYTNEKKLYSYILWYMHQGNI